MAITLGSGHQDFLYDRTVPFTDTILDFKSTYFTANLTGAQEVPANASTKTGAATGALNFDQTRFEFVVTLTGVDIDGLQTPGTNTDNLSNFHIHKAAPGVSGGIVYDPGGDGEYSKNAGAGTLSSGWDTAEGLSAANIASLLANGTYFNVHTVAFPGGEIRGQIIKADSGLDRIDLTQLNIGSFETLQKILTEGAGSATIGTFLAGQQSQLTLKDIGISQLTAADFIFAGNVNDTIVGGNLGRDDLFGAGGDDDLRGLDGDDMLYGETGSDTLRGDFGNDRLDGGTGVDKMTGGAGDDTYILDSNSDTTVEATGGGNDTVIASVTHALRNFVEDLTLDGIANINGAGNSLSNFITGNSGSNILNGLGGADTMIGGGGNDTYYVDNLGDNAIELAGAGIDIIRSTVDRTLDADVEKLYLLGAATDGTGNALSNFIYGNSLDNKIDGGAVADRLSGFGGNDTYIVDSAGDLIYEQAGQGNDTVQSSVNHTLAVNVENLSLSGAGNINGTGNTAANVVGGNGGNNFIDGKLGNDTLLGGAGLDNFLFTTALAGNTDSIGDFTVADDTMRLDDAVFAGLAAGFLAASAFRNGGAAADADDRIIYDAATGDVFFDSDGTGAAAQVKFASVSTGLAIANTDFFVF